MFLSCLILTKVDDNQRNFCGVDMTDLFSSVPEKASLQDVLIAFPHASNELLKYIEKYVVLYIDIQNKRKSYIVQQKKIMNYAIN